MDGWKLSDFKAHQQFQLGRIDGLKWSLANLNLDDQNKDLVWDKIRFFEKQESEASIKIRQILDERAEKLKASKSPDRKDYDRFDD